MYLLSQFSKYKMLNMPSFVVNVKLYSVTVYLCYNDAVYYVLKLLTGSLEKQSFIPLSESEKALEYI